MSHINTLPTSDFATGSGLFGATGLFGACILLREGFNASIEEKLSIAITKFTLQDLGFMDVSPKTRHVSIGGMVSSFCLLALLPGRQPRYNAWKYQKAK